MTADGTLKPSAQRELWIEMIEYGGAIVSIKKGANQGKRRQICRLFRHEFDLGYHCEFWAVIGRGDGGCAEKRGGGITMGLRS